MVQTASARPLHTAATLVESPSDDAQLPASQAEEPVRFSIVIPLYNKAPYVRCTVESALAQTFTDLEVIVIDDGSSDGGAELLASIDDPRLRVVRQANAGVSRARNRAISLARGEWVAFLDADDWKHPDFLASLVAAQESHPQVDAVATRYVNFQDSDGTPIPMCPVPAGPFEIELITDLPSRWMTGPTFMTSSVAVRTTRLRQMQPCFPPGESFGEDLDLLFRVAEQTAIALIHAPLVAYRVDAQGSLTTQYRQTVPPFLERMRARALSGAMSTTQSKSALRFVAQLKLDLAREALGAGRRLESLRWLIDAHHASSSKRWWLTAMMVLVWPSNLVRRYLARARTGDAPVASPPASSQSNRGLRAFPSMLKRANWPTAQEAKPRPTA